MLRRQTVRCLLSIKDIDPLISDEYLPHLYIDEQLLRVSERIEDEDLPLFLICFVEINLERNVLEIQAHGLLNAYKKIDMEPLKDCLNAFVGRLGTCGIRHSLPLFTMVNLPPIQIPCTYTVSRTDVSPGYSSVVASLIGG